MKFSSSAFFLLSTLGISSQVVQADLVVPNSLKLDVKVINGKACKADTFGGKSDAYVKVYWVNSRGSKKYCGKTSRKDNTKNPTWNQKISCGNISKSAWGSGIKIYFEMWDYDNMTKDDKIGSAQHSRVYAYGEHSAGRLSMGMKKEDCGGSSVTFETFTPMKTYKFCSWCSGSFSSLSIRDDYHNLQEQIAERKKEGVIGEPGDVVTTPLGDDVKLKDGCGHSVMVTLCTRKKSCGTMVEYGTVKVDSDHLDKEKKELEKLGYVIFAPGDTVDFGDKKGLVESDCSIKEDAPSVSGDPHFKKWNGEIYDFHGGCDLVLMENPGFGQGVGMNIHVRTKVRTWWSHVESAAIQIGENKLQVTGGTGSIRYILNGEEKELETGDASLGDYAVRFRRVNDHQSQTRVDLGNYADAIAIETYKEFVRVNILDKQKESFDGSKGLLGLYPHGEMIGRDGATVFEDPDAFGQEWMVRPADKIIFHGMSAGDLPLQCHMPDQTQSDKARRLGESMISEEDASLACARVSSLDRDSCIFDVMATNDVDIVGSY